MRASAVTGELPGEGPAVVGSVRLPAGRVERTGDGVPLFWVTDAGAVDFFDVWLGLAEAFPGTGLWPIIFDIRPDFGSVSDSMYFAGPQPRSLQSLESISADLWRRARDPDLNDPDQMTLFLEIVEPFGREFPGLAPESVARTAPVQAVARELVASLHHPGPKRLGLLAVSRPSDSLLVTGWSNELNYYPPVSTWSAVLESWEDRFGAYVASFGAVPGGVELGLIVERCPQNREDLLLFAAEIYGFAPDVIDQDLETVRACADHVSGRSVLMFMWD